MEKKNNKYTALLNVMKRELRRLVSRPLYLFCMVIAPLFCYIFFTTLMDSGLPTDMPVGVVDRDMTATSRQLVRNLDAFEQTAVVARYPDISDARIAMQKGEIYGFYYIPEGTAAKAQAQRQPKVSFYTNNTLLIAGSLLFKDMKMMSELASGAAARTALYAKGATEEQAMAFLQPIVIDTHPLNNPWLNYSVYLCNTFAPGVLMLLIFMITVYSIGVEIKDRTAREWLRTGNGSIWISLAGKPHAAYSRILPYGNLIQHIPVRFPAFPLQQRNTADAARHALPGAGIARHGHTDDRYSAHPASGTQLCFPMGRTVVLHVRTVISRHGDASRTARPGKPVSPAPLLPYLRRPGPERLSHDLLVDELCGTACFHDASFPCGPQAERSIDTL